MKYCCTILLILFPILALSQNYTLNYSFDYERQLIGSGEEYVQFDLFTDYESFSFVNNGTVTVLGKPKTLIIYSYIAPYDENGDLLSYCGPNSQTINLNLNDCDVFLDAAFQTICSGTSRIYLRISPILDIQSNQQNQDAICESTLLQLTANSGFTNYQWQYRNSLGNWTDFATGSEAEIAFTLGDLLGASINDYYNQQIYFRYTVDNCSYTNAPVIYYTLGPQEPIPFIETAAQLCSGEADAFINVVGHDRELLADENIVYTLEKVGGGYSNNLSSGNFQGLSPGSYSLSISGYNYCNSPSEYLFNIAEASPMVVDSSVFPASCKDSPTGSVTFNISGGTGPEYLISIDGSPHQLENTFSGLLEGQHSANIIDENGCEISQSFNISGPPETLDATVLVESGYNGSQLSCPEGSDASIEVIASGGWGNYEYSLNETGPFSSIKQFDGLSAGINYAWIKDEKGCLLQKEFEVISPDKIEANIGITDPLCPGDYGQLTIEASGGTGNLLYSIDGSNFQLLNQFFGPSGTYSIYVKDENSCLVEFNNIELIDPEPISYKLNIVSPDCAGNPSGQIELLDISFGSPPYQFSIDGGAAYQSSASFKHLPSGNYSLIIRDVNNCLVTEEFEILDPEPITGVISSQPISCFDGQDGSLFVDPRGGSGTYSFLWSNGATTQEISNLSAGSYSVQIIDDMGCQGDSIHIELKQPDQLIVTEIMSDYGGFGVSCANGSDGEIELIISGGTIIDDYTFLWDNGEKGSRISNLSAGEYGVTITDDNSCQFSESFTLKAPPELTIINQSTKSVTCAGQDDGEILIEVAGGNGSLSYNLVGLKTQPTGSFTGMAAGKYMLEVSDENGCFLQSEIIIDEPSEIEILNVTAGEANCGKNDGSIEISATGGNPPYSYEWFDMSGNSIGNTAHLTAIGGGDYEVTISDSNSCQKSFLYAVSNIDGPEILVIESSGVSCHGQQDGYAQIEIIGGAQPYGVSWDNGRTGLLESNLAAGNYSIQVKDANGCLSYLELEIPDTEAIFLSEVVELRPNCQGESNGGLELYADGGTPPYTVSWEDGYNKLLRNDLSAGTYNLTISDYNSCSLELAVVLTEPQELNLEAEITAPSCATINDGVINLNPGGGSPPYTFNADGAQLQDHSLTNLSSGKYSIELVDNNGCLLRTDIEVPVPEPIIVDLPDLTICDGQVVKVHSPILAKEYNWITPNGNVSKEEYIEVSSAGDYSLELITEKDCPAEAKFRVAISDEVLNIDFLASSEILVADTLIIIDITYPIPDSVNWIFPAGVEIIETNNDYAMIIFNRAGIFDIHMEAFLAKCYEIDTKRIEVIDIDRDGLAGGRILGNEEDILEVSAYPNPTDMMISATCILSSSLPAEFVVIDLANNRKVVDIVSDAKLNHEYEIDLSGHAPGLYALVFYVKNETQIIRVLKR